MVSLVSKSGLNNFNGWLNALRNMDIDTIFANVCSVFGHYIQPEIAMVINQVQIHLSEPFWSCLTEFK